MKTLYKIDAVHPILKRVVKNNMYHDEMIVLFKELEAAGYESENIKLTWENVAYCFGCGVKLTKENFTDKFKAVYDRTGIELCEDCNNAKNFKNYLSEVRERKNYEN